MTINTLYEMVCTQCQRQLPERCETEEELMEAAVHAGWAVRRRVPNGSEWDFCPRCSCKEQFD